MAQVGKTAKRIPSRAKRPFGKTPVGLQREARGALTPIVGYVELLRNGELGELSGEQVQALEVVERNARRLLRLL